MKGFNWPMAGYVRLELSKALKAKITAIFGITIFGLASLPSKAQVSPVIQPGFKAVTGFSGTRIPSIENGLPPGVDPLDETFIDLGLPTLRIFDVTNLGEKPKGQLVYTPSPFEVKAGQIGHVFGLAYDDGKGPSGNTDGTPNLYATATSLFGIQIVENDSDADGRPERLKLGKQGARFMDGQFGPNNEGPGAIYKIDGTTGNASLFATIPNNTGAGLGNIAFDRRNRQFFVSDLDTGLIHRISIDGKIIDSFDHGVTGLPTEGFAPFPDDGLVMDITNPSFNIEDPKTWGYTQDERRVWGVGVLHNRLYYAVGSQTQIWSVGIAADGSFIDDARLDIKVKARRDYPVTDIAFDENNHMYLAQRGPTENKYDYIKIARSGEAEVLRYVSINLDDPLASGRWEAAAQSYATGFAGKFNQTTGGIDLQYGYDRDGIIDYNKCTQTLFKTGDDLRNNPSLAQLVNAPSPNTVHGTQLTTTKLVRPLNVPPFGSWFFDLDGFFDDPPSRGHIGDVEVWRPCAGTQNKTIDGPDIRYTFRHVPGEKVRVKTEQCLKVEEVQFSCDWNGNLIADFYMGAPAVPGANTLQTNVQTPGISRWPLRQTRKNGLYPFSVQLGNTFPGDPIDFNFCIYDGNAAKIPGVSFPCCKANIQVPAPDFVCK